MFNFKKTDLSLATILKTTYLTWALSPSIFVLFLYWNDYSNHIIQTKDSRDRTLHIKIRNISSSSSIPIPSQKSLLHSNYHQATYLAPKRSQAMRTDSRCPCHRSSAPITHWKSFLLAPWTRLREAGPWNTDYLWVYGRRREWIWLQDGRKLYANLYVAGGLYCWYYTSACLLFCK